MTRLTNPSSRGGSVRPPSGGPTLDCPIEIDLPVLSAAEEQVLRIWVARHVTTDLSGLKGPTLALNQVTTAIGLVSDQLA